MTMTASTPWTEVAPLWAQPPAWALAAGCPAPGLAETFSEYARRLGLDPDELTRGLLYEEREVANARLQTAIMRGAPASFRRAVSARLETCQRRGFR